MRPAMVYTDGTLLIADTIEELYQYAKSIGLNSGWIDFMGRNLHPHFHLFGHIKNRVLNDDKVQQVTLRELITLLRLNYRVPETKEQIEEWEQFHNRKFSERYIPSTSDYTRMIAQIFKRTGLK